MNRERRLHALLDQKFATLLPPDWKGIGDDAAVIPLGSQNLCLCTDLFIENQHFRRSQWALSDVGMKAVAVCLSDLAAMGARPLAIACSMAVSSHTRDSDLEDFFTGVQTACTKWKAPLVGGDTSSIDGPMTIDITALGLADGDPLLRSTAEPGDFIAVSGFLGEAYAGRRWLELQTPSETQTPPPFVRAFVHPEPKLEIGWRIQQSQKGHAMMDLSDGLAIDLLRLCQASQVGCEIQADWIPISQETRAFATELGENVLDWAFSGGEDYELLFTLAPSDWDEFRETMAPDAKVIGHITEMSTGCRFLDSQRKWREINEHGWNSLPESP